MYLWIFTGAQRDQAIMIQTFHQTAQTRSLNEALLRSNICGEKYSNKPHTKTLLTLAATIKHVCIHDTNIPTLLCHSSCNWDTLPLKSIGRATQQLYCIIFRYLIISVVTQLIDSFSRTPLNATHNREINYCKEKAKRKMNMWSNKC